MEQTASLSSSIPAPTGGWNARDPLEIMPETDAIRLKNFFPEPNNVTLRRGFRTHTPSGMGTNPVQTLVEYSGAQGTRTLLAAANGNIYDCTTLDGVASSLSGAIADFSVNKWQSTMFKGTSTSVSNLVLVNGTDPPQVFNGTALSVAARPFYSTINDENKLIDVVSFKTRLFFLELDLTNSRSEIWYGAVNASTGALTAMSGGTGTYGLGALFKRGGYGLWIATWGRDSGAGLEDLFVVCSNMGEILVFSGDNPGAANWALVGRYFIPPPLGIRSKIYLDADILIITLWGVVPMSKVIAEGGEGTYEQITDKIQDAFNQAARESSSNFGWEGLVYGRNHSLYINVPIVESTQSEQYVMNLITGAWCQFTGMNAICWALHNDKPYFGTATGTVCQADYGQADISAAIPARLKTAFNYLGDRASSKKFNLARCVRESDEDITFSFQADSDFREDPITSVISTSGASGSEWDTSPWDTTEWASGSSVYNRDWRSIYGFGKCAALKVEVDATNVGLTINSFNVIYEPGGLL